MSTLSAYDKQSQHLAELASIAKARLQRIDALQDELGKCKQELAQLHMDVAQANARAEDMKARNAQLRTRPDLAPNRAVADLLELADAVINWQALRDDAWSAGTAQAEQQAWAAVELAQDTMLELANAADQWLRPRPEAQGPTLDQQLVAPALDAWLAQHAPQWPDHDAPVGQAL